MARRADATWWTEVLSGFLAGALAMAMLAGQVFAWLERRRIDLVGAR